MTDLRSGGVYIDTNPFVYALEGPNDLASALKALFVRLKDCPGIGVTSELTLAEVLPKRRVPDRDYLELLVWSKVFDLRPVSRDILYGTADYRRIASAKLPDGRVRIPKLPDSIHVVTAIKSGCRVFLSSDSKIKLPETIRFVRADIAGVASLVRELA
jgi:predicted nucleic acid-binding protein